METLPNEMIGLLLYIRPILGIVATKYYKILSERHIVAFLSKLPVDKIILYPKYLPQLLQIDSRAKIYSGPFQVTHDSSRIIRVICADYIKISNKHRRDGGITTMKTRRGTSLGYVHLLKDYEFEIHQTTPSPIILLFLVGCPVQRRLVF
jgi:hypothetical protein